MESVCFGVSFSTVQVRRARDVRTCMRQGGSGISMKMKSVRRSGMKGKSQTEIDYVQVEDPQYDAYKVDSAVQILKQGGVGVIPTDTCYAFACALSSRGGINRLYSLKKTDGGPVKKPLSLLCRDLAMVQTYVHSMDRRLFKLLKSTLPGPYTYILPASSQVPRMVMEHKSHRKSWKRKEIGVRIPDDPYAQAVLEGVDEPLLISGVPLLDDSMTLACNAFDIGENWCNEVDFVVDHGERPWRLSTVVDLGTSPPTIVREGEGDAGIFVDY
mmetsp:Transcript_17721/g.71508  ORF Transcript_17721/g.71508 Transcript_17721/m.71508 type:complete len:271 (-) Transcript_17721:770-1582(-)